MSLFNFSKKSETNASEGPVCSCNGPVPTYRENSEIADGESKNVKVLGGGCSKCEALLKNTNEALKNMNIPLEAEYITDMTRIAGYGIMSTPALMANEKVISMGSVPSTSDIEKLLRKIGY
jgi:small redox-active disulfide protein 2